MSEGWIGLDADSWGNVISAATGAGAILAGAWTVSRTAKLSRKARSEEQDEARQAELRVQSRQAVANLMDAALEYLQQGREIANRPPTTAKGVETWQARRAKELRAIEKAALLVHEPAVRGAIEAGVEAVRLTRYLMVYEDWEPEQIPKRVERIVGVMRDLAAAYLRDDAKSVNAEANRLRKARRIGAEARELMLQQERDDRAAENDEGQQT